MEPEPLPPNPDELLANAAWVRRSARRLVDDPQRAEDVAQDALAVALQPGSYLVELVRRSWTPTEPLEGPLPVEVLVGETARVRFGD